MMQNGNENPNFQLWETFYGHIRFQHYQIYQKTSVRERSMQSVDILGGLEVTVGILGLTSVKKTASAEVVRGLQD